MAAAAQPSEKSDGLVFHPMDQFIVEPLFGSGPIHWYTVTNVTLWMGLSVVALVLVMLVGTSKRALVPGRAQSIGELAYGFVHKMVEDVAGRDAVPYFPYIMTLFVYVHSSIEFPRSFAYVIHNNISYSGHCNDGNCRFSFRYSPWIREKWRWIFLSLLDIFSAISTSSGIGLNRNYFLFR